jgi:glycosyltransferase involved in cell wall biosynthesis
MWDIRDYFNGLLGAVFRTSNQREAAGQRLARSAPPCYDASFVEGSPMQSLFTSRAHGESSAEAGAIRVALVIQEYQRGGAEQQAALIARSLAERLGACDVITTRTDVEGTAGVRLRRLGARHKHGFWRLHNLLATFTYFALYGHRYSVVHGFCLSSLVLGALLGGRLRGCRTVLRVCTIGDGGDIAKIKARRFGRLVWSLFLRADVFTAFTPGMVSELCSEGIPPARIALQVGAVSACDSTALTNEARAEARAAIGLAERPTVLCIGRWVAQKRIDVILEAWRLLGPTHATLVLVGDGPERTRITAWYEHSGCAGSVRILGWHPHPEMLYRAADILVFVARDEAFGNVVAEAMAHGLAPITTRTGLANHLIGDDVNGILIDDDAPDQVARALRQLIDDPERRRRLGYAAWQTARESFDPAVVVDELVALYRQLVDHGRLPAQLERHVA